jgi:hypothetical protein
LKTFDFTLDAELNFLEKYHLTPTELMAIKTILLAQDSEDEYIFKFNNILTFVNIKFRDLLISLQNKGIILKSYKIPEEGSTLNLEEIEMNKNFVKNFYKSSFELGKELFEEYPMFGEINGSIVPLRGVAKKFNSLEDFYRFYGKSIKWNIEKHNHIIELVRWAKDNTTFLNCSISSFCINQLWNELEALKEGKIININFDSVKLV